MSGTVLEGGTPAAILSEATERALSRRLGVSELFQAAEQLTAAGEKAAAVQLYRTFVALNPNEPMLFAVLFNLGVALAANGDAIAGLAAQNEAIRVNPDFQQAYINAGRLLEDLGRPAEAVARWTEVANRLGSITGEALNHKIIALQQIGRLLEEAHQDEPAEAALRHCLDVQPDQPEVLQHWIALRMRRCLWPVLEPMTHVTRETLLGAISPLSLANLADDPMFQLAVSDRYCRSTIGLPNKLPTFARPAAAPARDGQRLRIGYVSSDLREHAVGFAMTDVLETHDRAAVEVHAYYCGIAREDPTRARCRAAVEHWTDINGLEDGEVARKIAEDGIDILVDLNGYTKSARTRVFALRPAPIAVNWFGFPGTMGSPYHHYLIADPFVIPASHELYYSERVLRLPCYQPNDRHRVVATYRPSRADEGLPDGAVVFCCLNGMQKVTEPVFARWMVILHEVPGSVLWLLDGSPETNERLRSRAAALGIAPERLIFAPKRANPDHLARYPLADLFLDTFPYGAHTTAADALWMGVPIVTLPGRSFASRVCGSVVTAAGLGELVSPTPDDYVRRAILLGRDPTALAALKARLRATRDTCLLFNTPQLVRSLETLYRQMWEEYQSGQRPRPQVDGLDVYHRIGADLEIEAAERLSDEAYRGSYTERLAHWDETYPLRPDTRFWTGGDGTDLSI